MEVEFLSNMRYSLFVSNEDWKGWHTTLGRFWAFWDKAQRAPVEVGSRISAPINLSLPVVPPSLPSPPPSNSSSPPFSASQSFSMQGYPHQLGVPSLIPAHSPITPMPQPDFQSLSRKRPFDPAAAGMQPPTKRVTRSMAPTLSNSGAQFPLLTPLSTPAPVPRLSINVFPSTPSTQQPQHHTASTLSSNQLPLPGTRAMASVYSQQPPISPVSVGPVNHNVNFGSQSRNTSPYSQHNSIHHSATSSPTTPGFSQQQSPNWILGNRNSPYRPVRGVNTLLVPPPSMSAEPPTLCYDQMHYQPLGKSRTEYKTGIVPYMQTETWPQVWPVPYTDFSF